MYSIHSYAIIHFVFSSDQLVVIVVVDIVAVNFPGVTVTFFATYFDTAAASVPAVFDASSYILDGNQCGYEKFGNT